MEDEAVGDEGDYVAVIELAGFWEWKEEEKGWIGDEDKPSSEH